MSDVSKRGKTVSFRDSLAGVDEGGANRVIEDALRNRCLDELGLAAVAMRRDHHASGDLVRDAGPMVSADDVQAGVDPGRGSSRGHDAAAVDVEDTRVDRYLGQAPREQVGV